MTIKETITNNIISEHGFIEDRDTKIVKGTLDYLTNNPDTLKQLQTTIQHNQPSLQIASMKMKEYILSHTFEPQTNDNLHFTFKSPHRDNCKMWVTLEQLQIKVETNDPLEITLIEPSYTTITVQLTKAEMQTTIDDINNKNLGQYSAAFFHSRLIIKLYNFLVEQEFIQPIEITT